MKRKVDEILGLLTSTKCAAMCSCECTLAQFDRNHFFAQQKKPVFCRVTSLHPLLSIYLYQTALHEADPQRPSTISFHFDSRNPEIGLFSPTPQQRYRRPLPPLTYRFFRSRPRHLDRWRSPDAPLPLSASLAAPWSARSRAVPPGNQGWRESVTAREESRGKIPHTSYSTV